MHIIEGSYVDDGRIIYAVKGLCNYERYLVVVPKYNLEGCTRFDFMRSIYNCPEQAYISNIGRKVCVIQKDSIMRYYDPYRYSSYRIPSLVKRFIELISNNLYNGEVGLTGSHLLGCPSSGSDIDLIIATSDPQSDYESLLRLRSEGIIVQCRDYETTVNYRDKIEPEGNLSLESYLILARYKVLEGCYRGARYSIRMLNPFDTEWCRKRFHYISRTRLVAEVIPVSNYTTPALYEVLNVKSNNHYYMATWRLRFSELPRNTYVIEGDLYIDDNGTRWIIPDIGGSIDLL